MIIGDPNDYDWQTDHVYNLCILIIRDLMIMINRQWQTGTCEIYDGENDHKSALSKVDHMWHNFIFSYENKFYLVEHSLYQILWKGA